MTDTNQNEEKKPVDPTAPETPVVNAAPPGYTTAVGSKPTAEEQHAGSIDSLGKPHEDDQVDKKSKEQKDEK